MQRLALIPILVLGLGFAPRAAGLEPGTELSFRGGIAPLEGAAAGTAEKQFELTILVGRTNDEGTTLDWVVTEQGRGGFSWPERFGRLAVDRRWQGDVEQVPALLYVSEEATTVVPLPLPLVDAPAAIDVETEWTDGPRVYRAIEPAQQAGRDCWRVEMSNAYGRQQVIWLDRASPLALALTKRVFMGQGVEYELSLRLVEQRTLAAAEWDSARSAFDAALDLRQRLGRPPRTESGTFSAQQRELLAADLPALVERTTSGPLAAIVRSAQRDLKQQSNRAGDLADMATRYRGRAAEAFAVTGLGEARLTQADLAGQVTVLHFWDYRDTPLSEPYGQVGYLDFLHHRRQESGVRVYGVAVNPSLGDAQARPATLRSVRRLVSFMNLSYPILLDDGRLLSQFGDPRLVGAALPLFVVVGPDGTIAHWHAGYYEVDRDRGLKLLDDEVLRLLKLRAAGQ